MSPKCILTAVSEITKHAFAYHPFIIGFIAVFTLFSICSIILVTVIASDPDNHTFTPVDEERRIFLPSNSDSLYSPSLESAGSRSGFVPEMEKGASNVEVERLLAAHREHAMDGSETQIGGLGVNLDFEYRDILQGEESEGRNVS